MSNPLPFLTARQTIHLVRGHTQSRSFHSFASYDVYLELLKKHLDQYHVKLHAYVLTQREVHLLMTPCDVLQTNFMMESLEEEYQQKLVEFHGINQPPWKNLSRWRLIEPGTFLLPSMQDIENLPVRLNLCHAAIEHPWSSYACNALSRRNALISPHSVYLQLGNAPASRAARFRAFTVHGATNNPAIISQHIKNGSPPGDDQFKQASKGEKSRWFERLGLRNTVYTPPGYQGSAD